MDLNTVKEIRRLKREIKKLKEENKKLKEENKKLKEENEQLKRKPAKKVETVEIKPTKPGCSYQEYSNDHYNGGYVPWQEYWEEVIVPSRYR